jgi:hypothetical protein
MNRNVFLAIYVVSSIIGLLSLNAHLKKKDEKYEELLATARLNYKTVQIFAKYSSLEVVSKVMSEVEFDWVIRDLE